VSDRDAPQTASPAPPEGRAPDLAAVGAVLLLLGLFACSTYLAFHKLFQVDELMTLRMARQLGLGQQAEYYTQAPLQLLGPVSWLAARAESSVTILLGGRAVALGLFWLNLLLLTRAAGFRVRSREALPVLLAAATLAPLWDYGFEVRHDNLVLTVLLLGWLVARPREVPLRGAYVLLGLLCGLVQLVTFKSFIYWLPLSLLAIAAPHAAFRSPRWKLGLHWLAGGALGLSLGAGAHLLAGTTGLLLQSVLELVRLSSGYHASAVYHPTTTLFRLLSQTPLLLAVLLAACLLQLRALWASRSTRPWRSLQPELLLVLVCLGALIVNPAPFPYVLILLVPPAFLLAATQREAIARLWSSGPGARALLCGVFLFAQLVPFATATHRHLRFSNERQLQLIAAAEAMTDRARDRVYDASGLVLSRESIGYYWFLHTVFLPGYRRGLLPSVEQMMERDAAAVVIPSYRLRWLTGADLRFLRANYLPLAPDFWVLGRVLPVGGGEWQCLHAGRYHLGARKGARLDGKPVAGVVWVARGRHQIVTSPEDSASVVWLGPRLERPPRLGAGDPDRVFVNWY
jgi:hypothetical protein